MAGLLRIFVVLVLFGTTPGVAMANAVVPWFATENKSPASQIEEDQVKENSSPPSTAEGSNHPKKRLLSMSIAKKSIGKKNTKARAVPGFSNRPGSPAGGPLALLVSMVGLILIGGLTRSDPETKPASRI